MSGHVDQVVHRPEEKREKQGIFHIIIRI